MSSSLKETDNGDAKWIMSDAMTARGCSNDHSCTLVDRLT